MKRSLAVSRYLVLFSWLLATAAAQQFPRLQEESLAGTQVVLPDAASGKLAVLILGFSRNSSKPTGEWAKRIYQDFGRNPGVVIYQLAVLQDVPRLFRGMITSGIKKELPENQRATFLAVVQQEEELKKLVGYKEQDDAYLVLLDRSGTIAYQAHAMSLDPGYAALQTRIQAHLK
jgi:hypothetical protein